MQKISVLLPTRSRPGRFIESVVAMLRLASRLERIELIVYVDEDDPDLAKYGVIREQLMVKFSNLNRLQFFLGPPIGTNRCVNMMAEAAEGDILFHASDDAVMRTQGWDDILDQRTQEAYPDGVYLTWFDDGLLGDKMPVHPIVGRAWKETLGFFLPCYFIHLNSDARLMDIATRVGRTLYIKEALYEHCHHGHGAAQIDATYERTLQRNPFTLDNEARARTWRYVHADVALLQRRIKEGPSITALIDAPVEDDSPAE